MKNIKNIAIAALSLLLLWSCSDELAVSPDGAILTDDQVKEVVNSDPGKLQSEVNGLYSIMKAFPAALGDGDNQDDYGIPSILVKMEHNGQDVVGDITGYNWYSGEQDFTTRNYTYRAPRLIWAQFYNQIKTANSIIGKIEYPTTDAVGNLYLGQAFATRAYDYFNLAQLFQFTYKSSKDKPCVPILTDLTAETELNNQPRKTVEEVYTQIISDLDKAILCLSADGVTARANKSVIDLGVAYGIRARVKLVMEDWAGAEADAQSALTASGEAAMSLANVSIPTFDDASASGIMWGVIITAEDDCVKSGICNFTSMFTNLCYGYGGYTTIVSCWKKINKLLYDQIPATDVRKGWFLDENYHATALSDYETSGDAEFTFGDWNGTPWSGYDSTSVDSLWYYMGMEPYTSVKFAPNNKVLTDPDNATDVPLMRAEEMLLIIAEAKAMDGDLGGGKMALEDFVTSFRDPSFTSTATDAVSFQDEVWLQRRIEFWGEGISWFDVMRLEKPLIRYVKNTDNSITTNYGSLAIFNVPADAKYRLWPIPKQEIEANEGISEGDNNEMGALPESLPQPTALRAKRSATVSSMMFKKTIK